MTEVADKTEIDAQKSSISLASLKHALKVCRVANSKANLIPILSGVRIEQIESGLALEATDLELYIRVVIPELAGPTRAIVTPAEKFAAWTQLLSGETVQISATQKRATVKCGRGKATLPLLSATDWPANDVYALQGATTTLTQGAFARALRFAQITLGEDNPRLALNGVKVIGDGTRLRLVSTDGHCLVLYTLPSEEKIDLLLPARMVKAILPLITDEAGGVDVVFDSRRILASIDADVKTYVGGNQMTGQYPRWEAIMPTDKRSNVTVNAADLLASLERCFVMSDERTSAIDVTFSGGEITLHAADVAHGEADETVPFSGDFTGELRTRINGSFLKVLLRKLDSELVIALPDNNSKALLFKAQPHEGETLDYIIMPMRRD